MLLGNRSVIHKSPATFMSGTLVSEVRTAFDKSGQSRNKYINLDNTFSRKDGEPVGYRPPYSYFIAQTDGGMGSYARAQGYVTNTTNLAGGLNGEASITGLGQIPYAEVQWLIQATSNINGSGTINSVTIVGSVEAVASLIGLGDVSNAAINVILQAAASLVGSSTFTGDIAGKIEAIANISGSGYISNAFINVVLQAIAALNGSGSINADILGKWQMEGSLSGIGNVVASIKGIADLIKNLVGNGAISAADLRAIANITANVTPFTELSPENIAFKVWQAQAVLNNESGTMGEKLNDAGSAANPWTDVSSYGAGTKGKMLEDILGDTQTITGNTQNILIDTQSIVSDISSISSTLDIIKGLVQNNMRITNQIYDSGNRLLSANITLYPTATDTTNQTNSIKSYSMTATYDSNGKCIDYKVIEL